MTFYSSIKTWNCPFIEWNVIHLHALKSLSQGWNLLLLNGLEQPRSIATSHRHDLGSYTGNPGSTSDGWSKASWSQLAHDSQRLALISVAWNARSFAYPHRPDAIRLQVAAFCLSDASQSFKLLGTVRVSKCLAHEHHARILARVMNHLSPAHKDHCASSIKIPRRLWFVFKEANKLTSWFWCISGHYMPVSCTNNDKFLCCVSVLGITEEHMELLWYMM